MISLLIWLLFFVILMYIAYLLAAKFIADSTLRTIVLLIIGLIGIVVILSNFGYMPSL